MKNRWAALSMLSGSVLFGLPLLAAAQGTHSGAAGLEAVLAESAETPASTPSMFFMASESASA